MWLISTCSTVVMIVEPPGEPAAKYGAPSFNTMVGLMLDRGRLPGAGRFGSYTPGADAAKSKSVISLFSRKPRPGTVIPLPAICSMVLV